MNILDFALSVRNGQFESIVWEGSMSSMRKTNNPYVGRVRKIVRGINYQFGVSYENKVNNERERMGLERDFVSQSPKGKEWVEYPKVLRSIKDSEKMYLRASTTANSKTEIVYLVDNRLATKEEVEEILSFIPTHEPTMVFDLSLDKILKWNVGGETYQKAETLASLAEMVSFAK